MSLTERHLLKRRIHTKAVGDIITGYFDANAGAATPTFSWRYSRTMPWWSTRAAPTMALVRSSRSPGIWGLAIIVPAELIN